MAREVTLKCDICKKAVETIACKIYLAPVLPGKASTSFMSGYSHWADVCSDCMSRVFLPRMKKRQARNGGGPKKTPTPTAKASKKQTKA